MNGRKPTDYSALFAALNTLLAAEMPQMELYCEIGRLVSGRMEKGAAVAAAEYLHGAHPDLPGFSPRNLRRMRDFYRAYAEASEVLAEAMTIGWTQNVVILEAGLTIQEKLWYIRAVRRFGWSKAVLAEKIASAAYLEIALDLGPEVCYTGKNSITECANNDEHPFRVPWEYLSEPDGRVRDERPGEKSRTGSPIPHRVRRHQHGVDRQPGLSPGAAQAGRTRHRLRWQNGAAAHQRRLRSIRSADWDGSGQPAEYAPHLRRRLRREAASADGLYRPSRRCQRSLVHRRL